MDKKHHITNSKYVNRSSLPDSGIDTNLDKNNNYPPLEKTKITDKKLL